MNSNRVVRDYDSRALPLRLPVRIYQIKIDLITLEYEDIGCMQLAQDTAQLCALLITFFSLYVGGVS
jgi:hypothetical protein